VASNRCPNPGYCVQVVQAVVLLASARARARARWSLLVLVGRGLIVRE
jgi:hypothetical protein